MMSNDNELGTKFNTGKEGTKKRENNDRRKCIGKQKTKGISETSMQWFDWFYSWSAKDFYN